MTAVALVPVPNKFASLNFTAGDSYALEFGSPATCIFILEFIFDIENLFAGVADHAIWDLFSCEKS